MRIQKFSISLLYLDVCIDILEGTGSREKKSTTGNPPKSVKITTVVVYVDFKSADPRTKKKKKGLPCHDIIKIDQSLDPQS